MGKGWKPHSRTEARNWRSERCVTEAPALRLIAHDVTWLEGQICGRVLLAVAGNQRKFVLEKNAVTILMIEKKTKAGNPTGSELKSCL